jgi:hypothetical protein
MTFTASIVTNRRYGQQQNLSQYLRDRMDELAHKIENAPDRLSHDVDYAKRIIQKYTLEPLTVHWDKKQNTLEKKTISAHDIDPSTAFRSGLHLQSQSIQQNFVVCKVPCSGDLGLFRLRPSRSASMPKIIVDHDSISFEVFLNEHDSDATKREIEYYTTCINQQVANIRDDIERHNFSLASTVERHCHMRIQKNNKLAAIIGDLGISLHENPSESPVVELTPLSGDDAPIQYYSAAISYGGMDEAVATKLNDYLKLHGIKTWFYKDDGLLGQKLYEMMFNMANDYDRVILLCSESSLSRTGVLNELERVLEREAKESGSSILMPIALDDYIFGAKVKAKRHHLAQILTRNIGKINATDLESTEIQKQFNIILKSLQKLS